MKKIGILTYFWGTNPGSVLQAYSTLTLLKNKFPEYDVEVINYQPKEMKPGHIWNYFNIEFTRIFFSPNSAARHLIEASTAAFEAL